MQRICNCATVVHDALQIYLKNPASKNMQPNIICFFKLGQVFRLFDNIVKNYCICSGTALKKFFHFTIYRLGCCDAFSGFRVLANITGSRPAHSETIAGHCPGRRHTGSESQVQRGKNQSGNYKKNTHLYKNKAEYKVAHFILQNRQIMPQAPCLPRKVACSTS